MAIGARYVRQLEENKKALQPVLGLKGSWQLSEMQYSDDKMYVSVLATYLYVILIMLVTSKMYVWHFC